MSNKKKKGRESDVDQVNIQKSLSIASLPQSSLYNRSEKAVCTNYPTDEILRWPHQGVQRSDNTASR